jgi:hypothetical protein
MDNHYSLIQVIRDIAIIIAIIVWLVMLVV